MGKGLLIVSQGRMPITEGEGCGGSTKGSYLSQKVIPLQLFDSPHSRFCILQPAFHLCVRSNKVQYLGINQAQTRSRAHHLSGELFKQASHYRMLIARPDKRLDLLDQVSRPGSVVGADGMAHCLIEISPLSIPLACSQVQGWHRFAFCLLQPIAQYLRK